MPKRLIRIVYSAEEIKQLVNANLDIEAFERHCVEVAEKFNVDPIVVKELLIDNSIQTLTVLQTAVIKNEAVKVNIYGFFSFITERIYKKNLKMIYKKLILNK